MGYWENTAYLKSNSVSKVTKEMTQLFQEEGMVLIAAPKPRERQWYEPMQYAPSLENNLWGVAVFPGEKDWVIIKSAPLDLLGERSLGRNKIRLVSLCERLKTLGFLYNVYDTTGEILLETTGDGKYQATGFNPSSDNLIPMSVVDETNFKARFIDLPFQDILDKHELSDDRANAFSEALGGENKSFCDNLTSVASLIPHKPVNAQNGVTLYYKWEKRSRVKTASCSLNEWAKMKSSSV